MKLWLLFALVLGLAGGASAQSAPAAKIDPTLLQRMREPDQGGGLHFTEHLAVVFGGIKQGSGIAIGPALSAKSAAGDFVQLKGVYSIKKFKLLQLRYDTRRFWKDRAMLTSRLRWQDAPELSLYQLGPESPNLRAEFGEQKTSASSQVILQLSPAVRVSTGLSIERFRTTGGALEPQEGPEGLPDVPPLPGLGSRPLFAHTFVSIGFDTRLSPDYSRDGRFFEALIRSYNDTREGDDSFGRFEATAQQLIPTHGSRGVIDLSLRTWLSFSGDNAVPFFLMPTLGGGDLLHAFPSYRFRDRDALLWKAEYRWAVHQMLDVAGVYEAGKVGPQIENLGFRDMAHSIGIGVRAHTDKAALFRADVAHGREGFGFRIGFSAGGS